MSTSRLALIIRSGPFSGRSARSQLDIAVAAASLEIQLELFFIGPGVLQIFAGTQAGPALLPGGSKGWKSLQELTEVNAWIEKLLWQTLRSSGQSLLLNTKPLEAAMMRDRWVACDRVLVL